MITGIIIGIVGTLVVALNLPRKKRDPDSYGRQQWNNKTKQ